MTVSYSLGFVPKWYIADLVGRPLGGGYLATFSSLDHTLLNPVFEDPAGLFPWPYVTIPNVGKLGILFDENGSQGPFYFKFDSALPNSLYYLEVYDSSGVLQWTIDNYIPSSGGGGSIITEAFNLTNLVVNNVFWRTYAPSANSSPFATSTFLTLANGVHDGLAKTVSNAGPDIVFIKNNTSATDTLAFPNFVLGSNQLTGDVTPQYYLNYTCSVAGSSETTKLVQFPITRGVQNLNNTAMTVTIWARSTAGNANLTLQWRQFFGDGAGASADVITPIATQTVTSTWTKYSFSATVPSVSGKVLGACGNDGLFLQVQYPLGATTSMDFIKPSLYVGAMAPDADYLSYDMIDAVIYAKRTGDILQSYNATLIAGYVAMNDGTIGNPTSGASTRAATDTFPLFNFLYANVSDTWAPVSGGRTGDSVADWTGGKVMTLPRQLGRVLGSAGAGAGLTARALGEFLGEETHTLTIPEMPAHHHTLNATASGGSGGGVNTLQNSGATELTQDTGGGGAHNNMQPSSFVETYIKL